MLLVPSLSGLCRCFPCLRSHVSRCFPVIGVTSGSRWDEEMLNSPDCVMVKVQAEVTSLGTMARLRFPIRFDFIGSGFSSQSHFCPFCVWPHDFWWTVPCALWLTVAFAAGFRTCLLMGSVVLRALHLWSDPTVPDCSRHIWPYSDLISNVHVGLGPGSKLQVWVQLRRQSKLMWYKQ